MTTRRRFWVEVTPRFAASPSPVPSPTPPAPRLTELAVAAGLEGAELDAELASVRRQRSALAAYEAGLVERKATLGARHTLPYAPVTRTDLSTAHGPDPAAAVQTADEFLPEEVAVLLNMSVPSARHLVEYLLTLVRQLPAVWHALGDGRIDDIRARVLVTALGHQATTHGGSYPDRVIDEIADRGIGWATAGCPPTTLKERLQAALVADDPAEAERRAEARQQTADITVTATGDGLVELRATHYPAAVGEQMKAQLTAHAQAMRADGDTRPLGVLRQVVHSALILRPWEAREPVTAHLTVTTELADLIGLPDLPRLAGDPQAPSGPEPSTPPDQADQAGQPYPGQSDETQPDATATDEDEADEPRQSAGSPQPAGPPIASQGTAVPTTGSQGTGASTTGPEGTGAPIGGAGVGHVDGLPVTPAAVRALLQRVDALGLTHPDHGGDLAVAITGTGGRLLTVATPEELVVAAGAGTGLGPPVATAGYTPTAAQYRYLRARDRHCRFPGCRRVARACDADHARPYDHRHPRAGGPTCVTNLALLCRRHHRLKTHAPGWRFHLDPDGTLHVTTPGGTTRTTRPPAVDEVLDLLEPPPRDPTEGPPPF